MKQVLVEDLDLHVLAGRVSVELVLPSVPLERIQWRTFQIIIAPQNHLAPMLHYVGNHFQVDSPQAARTFRRK